MIPQQLSAKFVGISPYLTTLKKWVADTLTPYADTNGFPFYGRVKTVESLSEKIEMGRYRRFSEIDDLVAFTLIIPGQSFQQSVINFCQTAFDVIGIRTKSTTSKSPEVFRFDATRILAKAKMPPDFSGRLENSIFGYVFEVQIRTAFEHAWSVATHDLVYKGSIIDWKKVRLAAQLKATSESLDAAVAAFEPLSLTVTQSPWRDISEQAAVSQFIADLIDKETIPKTIGPSSVSRCAVNLHKLIRALEPKISIENALKLLDTQLKELKTLPVSLSFYQLCFGLLCSSAKVTKVDNRVLCHVTDELATLYPETLRVCIAFDYGS
jgi:ppGpp synthetase/RelA/SpoT-type nucleotidyltranferase